MFGFYVGLIVVVVLLIVLFGALVRYDEKQSYSFEELQLQLHDNKGEKLYCEITFYPWQRHKYDMIRSFYGIGKVVFISDCVYEIEEVRGPYRCSDAILQNELQFYVKEKKKKDFAIVRGVKVFIFEDSRMYFNTTPYLEELSNMHKSISLDENDTDREKRLLLLEELHNMSNTNTIMIQKIVPYLEVLREFGGINDEHNANILSVMEEILRYIKEVNIDCYVEKEGNMGKDTVTFNVNGGQVNVASGNAVINAVQNERISMAELDNLIGCIKKELSSVQPADAERIIVIIDMAKEELIKPEPKESRLKNCLTLLAPMLAIANGIPTLFDNLHKLEEFIMQCIR